MTYNHQIIVQDTISGRDFARSLVSGVQAAKVDTYLDRIDALPQALATKRVRRLLLCSAGVPGLLTFLSTGDQHAA